MKMNGLTSHPRYYTPLGRHIVSAYNISCHKG